MADLRQGRAGLEPCWRRQAVACALRCGMRRVSVPPCSSPVGAAADELAQAQLRGQGERLSHEVGLFMLL